MENYVNYQNLKSKAEALMYYNGGFRTGQWQDSFQGDHQDYSDYGTPTSYEDNENLGPVNHDTLSNQDYFHHNS